MKKITKRIWTVYPGEKKSAEQFTRTLRLCGYHKRMEISQSAYLETTEREEVNLRRRKETSYKGFQVKHKEFSENYFYTLG